MLTSDLDYRLPPELIAQHPVTPRDHSRLLVYDRARQDTSHQRLPGLLEHLNAGDALVYNDSRVLSARVHLTKPTGGKVELLFLRRRAPRLWEALVKPSARLRPGTRLELPPQTHGIFELRENLGSGRWLVHNLTTTPTEKLLERIGEMPLPPYIKARLDDPERYQTIYAEQTGSAAAPTAGLHFTPELIERIRAQGISLLPLTLHVGLDTFRPVSEDELELHDIHCEHYRMPESTFEGIRRARGRGGRVIAVGTTAVRVLETVFREPGVPLEGETCLFIIPGHSFQAVDALLTNFHLPRSTLLALVMAFAGAEQTRRLYREAVKEQYRFFSFGDAMLIL